MSRGIRVATDVGGTFTDLVYYDVDERSGRITIKSAKVHTTPPDFERGVLGALDEAAVAAAEIDFFAHGTTVVINALTERKGVKTGLITTRGFRDVLEIARGDRPDFFNLMYTKPAPFVPRYLRHEITERMTYRGEVHTPLAMSELEPILDALRTEGVQAIAICLLHSYANPAHEQALLAAVRSRCPELSVVASHQISREWREYERTNTTVLSAYVQPLAERYLRELEGRLRQRGCNGALYIMQSNGGIDTVAAASVTPITMVESGPASGVLAAAVLGGLVAERNIIALDIGGTTAKCSLIDDGRVQVINKYMIERSRASSGYPLMVPVVDIVEIGNGGGSIAWLDDDAKLHVGPRSAGAVPGPVAYGRGGTQPTTTDASLMTGRINPQNLLGGIEADMLGVRRAFERLGAGLGLRAQEAARGVIRIATHNMVNALKLVSINRGYDPRDFALVAFGGGGGMHATALALELSIPRVVIPANASVFSAWGMLMSDLRRDYVVTQLTALRAEALDAMNATLGALEAQALAAFVKDGFDPGRVYFERSADMRYEGQEHSVRVTLPPGAIDEDALAAIIARFHQRYEREYTYRLQSAVQLVGYHLVAGCRVDKPRLTHGAPSGPFASAAIKDRREVDFDLAGVCVADIYDRGQLGAGMSFRGPAIVEEAGSTTVVFPDQRVTVDEYGNLHITP